jgi:D-alanyl-D-alanine carboxypeptidase (penicillin-binding protein 5/6)
VFPIPVAALLVAVGLVRVEFPSEAVNAPDPYPKAAAAYLVAVNGAVLWARAEDQSLPPASLTKIMTAVVLLEEWAPEEIITVSPLAASASGSRLGLRAGDQLRARDALTALLVASANDVCLALAEHAAGSVSAFVARMNRKAAQLKLLATRFRNPCGLDAEGHGSSAADLLRLARLAMTNAEFARIVGQAAAAVTTVNGRRFQLKSGNLLLERVSGTVGIKSGFTGRAGKCLAALVRRGDDEVLIILLNAPNRWWSAAVLVEDAFAALDASRH